MVHRWRWSVADTSSNVMLCVMRTIVVRIDRLQHAPCIGKPRSRAPKEAFPCLIDSPNVLVVSTGNN
jgi:hypothetical protein